jgi:hypothetical protein
MARTQRSCATTQQAAECARCNVQSAVIRYAVGGLPLM